MAEVLVGGGQEAREGGFQRDGGAGRQHGESFGDRDGGNTRTGGRGDRASASRR